MPDDLGGTATSAKSDLTDVNSYEYIVDNSVSIGGIGGICSFAQVWHRSISVPEPVPVISYDYFNNVGGDVVFNNDCTGGGHQELRYLEIDIGFCYDEDKVILLAYNGDCGSDDACLAAGTFWGTTSYSDFVAGSGATITNSYTACGQGTGTIGCSPAKPGQKRSVYYGGSATVTVTPCDEGRFGLKTPQIIEPDRSIIVPKQQQLKGDCKGCQRKRQ